MYYYQNESRDIAAALLIMTLAFFILLNGLGFYGLLSLIYLAIAFLVVVTAFLFHELAHRAVARRLGAVAFFKLWPIGAFLALITSLFHFLFAAPGAVEFAGVYDNESQGKIALAGPATNIIIGIITYILSIFSLGIVHYVLYYVGALNLWFALFNMIPIPPLDGSKVFYWKGSIFAGVFVFTIIMNIVDGFLLHII
ncbi:zinc metalloprotease [Picrophilus oshimae]|nr:peptidase [Picrophilus oshimae]SMD31532.1 Zn-dependent protease (includes SpoIVFB) [Picrophilus oshimae DSM 9789]